MREWAKSVEMKKAYKQQDDDTKAIEIAIIPPCTVLDLTWLAKEGEKKQKCMTKIKRKAQKKTCPYHSQNQKDRQRENDI